MKYIFYRLRPGASLTGGQFGPSQYRWTLWRPSISGIWPPDPRITDLAWAAMHFLHLFSNNCYAQLLAHNEDQLIHRSAVYPRWSRYPFMGVADLQIGNTWTHPEYRRSGLAAAAIRRIVAHYESPDRAFWYVTDSQNHASIATAERAGFERVGLGARHARFGLRWLGFYAVETIE